MRKLTLKLDDLRVDSFDTSAAAGAKGTVFGEQCTCWTNCTCPGCPTCDDTACGQHTCGASCNGTCGDATCGGSCDYTCGGGGTCDQGMSCVWYNCGSAGASHCGPYACN